MKRGMRIVVMLGALIPPASAHAAGEFVEVLSTSGCGCCLGWVRHLEDNGYAPLIKHLPAGEFWQRKLELGLREGLTSCHTGLVNGYVVEGHVPAREIKRLLSERPDAIGLVVPDMPVGSPGMGNGGADAEPYQVLLLRKDGKIEVFARYP